MSDNGNMKAMVAAMIERRDSGQKLLPIERIVLTVAHQRADRIPSAFLFTEWVVNHAGYTCREADKCHINDDMQVVYQKLLEADGIIFGTPIYFYNMSAQAKIIIDRTYALRRPTVKLANKVGGIVTVAGNLGLMDAIKDLYFYMVINHMLAAEYVSAYATDKGAIKNNERAMKAAWELGREMAQLVMKKFEFPEEFQKLQLSAYVTEKYGL